MNKCRIGIIGLGTVGEGVYKILNSESDAHPILKEIEIVKIAVKNLSKKRDVIDNKELLTDNINILIEDPNIDVIVEVMGGINETKDIILKSLNSGKSVVTANKAVMARYGEEIQDIAAKNKVYILSLIHI